jgi:Ala-tRNA(Pro) deacylase
MAICPKLKRFLGERGVRYEVIDHPLAYAASDVARTSHIGPRMLVKAVVVDADGKPWMVAVAATQKVNLRKVAEALGVRHARLEKESDLAVLFGDCEPGAMPPFGNLYGMKVVADPVLDMDREIAFNAGDHTTVVKMAFEDFERLVQPLQAEVTGELDDDLYSR